MSDTKQVINPILREMLTKRALANLARSTDERDAPRQESIVARRDDHRRLCDLRAISGVEMEAHRL